MKIRARSQRERPATDGGKRHAETDDAWAAFESLVRLRHGDLRRFAHRLVGDPDRAEDALQDAYVKAYRALPRFSYANGGSQVGWLFQIVYRTCLDDVRRVRRDRRSVAADAQEPVGDAGGLDSVVIARASLSAALAELPAEGRAAVLLVDGHGFDYEAAAAILGIPRGTVASRLSAARAALRQVLGETDDT
jgi:RNA polymerase sigma-70 factor, ECF subfamily